MISFCALVEKINAKIIPMMPIPIIKVIKPAINNPKPQAAFG
jgi:hypothetical protein